MKVKLTNFQSVAFDRSAISSIRCKSLITRNSKKDYAIFSKEKKIARTTLQMEEPKKNNENNK